MPDDAEKTPGSDSRKGARLRAVAATVVDGVVVGGHSLDAELERHESEVSEADRSLLRLLCYGSLREHWQLREWLGLLVARPLKRRDRIVESLLAVGLYQIARTRIPTHAAVSATVDAARILKRPKLAGLINAVLRRFIRDDLASKPAASDEARHNHPRWMIDQLARDWPEEQDDILAANNQRAPMWLRVNSSRASSDACLAALEAAGITASVNPVGAIRLEEPLAVADLPGFHDGLVSVQDAGAQLAAPWLLGSVPTARRLLDACAAPGNKSAHLLELAPDDAELTAVDIDGARLDSVRDNLTRLSLSATVLEADASNPSDWWNGKPFDAILLDAPCSASGVVRRHPDIKLLRRPADIARLQALQVRMLQSLWPLLAPGGRLLYVTCSVFAAENDAVVCEFLKATPDARENDVLPNNNTRDVMHRKTRGYQVLPGAGGMDGFYFACLDKRQSGDAPAGDGTHSEQGTIG